MGVPPSTCCNWLLYQTTISSSVWLLDYSCSSIVPTVPLAISRHPLLEIGEKSAMYSNQSEFPFPLFLHRQCLLTVIIPPFVGQTRLESPWDCCLCAVEYREIQISTIRRIFCHVFMILSYRNRTSSYRMSGHAIAMVHLRDSSTHILIASSTGRIASLSRKSEEFNEIVQSELNSHVVPSSDIKLASSSFNSPTHGDI